MAMATRDQQPYAEHSDATASGDALYSLHNLTSEDLAQLFEGLRHRRVMQELRLQDKPAPPAMVTKKLITNAARLDLILIALQKTRHATIAKIRAAG